MSTRIPESLRTQIDAADRGSCCYCLTSEAVSGALADALQIFGKPVIELHISNIHARDELHRHSIVSASVKAVICGLAGPSQDEGGFSTRTRAIFIHDGTSMDALRWVRRLLGGHPDSPLAQPIIAGG